MKAKRMITNIGSHALLAVLSLIWVLPIFYVVLTSFREEGGTYKSYIWPNPDKPEKFFCNSSKFQVQ